MEQPQEYILEIEDLHLYFEKKTSTVKAVNGISFRLKRGETFGLLGESGCGKTMTCKTILKLIPENGKIKKGSIRYNGQEILNLSNREMRKIRGKEIGMIFQEPMTALNPVLKIREQILEQFIETKMSKEEKETKAIEMLRLVGIPSPETRLNDYIHQYSGGMRQRAMIAIALAAGPKILLADEPTTALDVTIQAQIIQLINSLKETLAMSIILITHDLGVVSQMCDNVAVMYAGYVMEMSDTLTVFSTPRHPYTEGLMHSLPRDENGDEALEPIQGAPPDLENLPKGCPFAERCKYEEKKCREEVPGLVQIAPGHWVRCYYWQKLDQAKGLIEVNRPREGGRPA